ncbi:hypothetical protein ER308_00195 [Egibacter rhizosphaerae]|uniref:Transglutaminase-like domain-containing protein n=1 Tax=Egibacter rhizosphaerae TaxID=1670831 RepID=A0A411YAB3_9ACTN|nr:DUF3488 and transglutaminase-like domain-containing protein [Egibacter rhizosphaerae]QBI18144.1 hypothetical protein ER308_00195 [Egibacter rhizosphaerae]
MSAPPAQDAPSRPERSSRSRPDREADHGPPARGKATGEAWRVLAAGALLAAALVPFGRVFGEWGALRPLVGAVLVAIGLAWAAHQLGAGSLGCAMASLLGWIGFTTAVLLPGTGVLGVVPTLDTLTFARHFTGAGLASIQEQAAPIDPEPAVLLLIVAGVWAIAIVVHDAVVVRGHPLRGILAALVLASVPLAIVSVPAEPGLAGTPAPWILPFLVAALFTLLAPSSDRATPAPRRTTPGGPGGSVVTGLAVGLLAIVAGVPLSGNLPGYNEPALYELTGAGGTAVTANPMVGLRPSLTAQDTGTVIEVTSPQPVYLRTTGLEVYQDAEQWTAEGRRIGGQPLGDGSPLDDVEVVGGQEVVADVEVVQPVDRLVPTPSPPTAIEGEPADDFLFDPRTGTVTLAGDASLAEGDSYEVTATIPDPDPDRVAEAAGYDPDGQLTELPDDVPQEAYDLAEEIVEAADADTPLEQALAIQDELQTWEYSLTPPSGHDGDALAAFLDHRVGYCEQYAGAMAVMLRTLDIPARVAVGFTSGTLADPEENRWEITNENAHAWVEVLFPGVGWIDFEPTPRDDGNILVPDRTDLAPTDTVAQDQATAEADAETDVDGQQDPSQPDDQPDFPDDMGLEQEQNGAAGTAGDASRGPGVGILAALSGVGLVGAAWIGWRLRLRATAPPYRRVLAARRRVEHLAAGLGVRAREHETDRDVMARLAVKNGRVWGPSVALANAAAAARFAPEPSASLVEQAERAADTIADELAPKPWDRAWLVTRGALGRLTGRLDRDRPD